MRACGKTELKDVGSDFGWYLDPSEIKEPGPPKRFVLVIWWTRLGSLRLCWADYEPSCTQNMNPTIHTYSYMQIYIYILQSKQLRNSKEIKKKQLRTLGILKK